MSSRYTLEIPSDAQVHILRAAGDLTIKGWGQARIECKTGAETMPLQVDGAQVYITLDDDAVLWVPYECALLLDDCAGDVRIKAVQRTVTLTHCSGSLDIRDGGGLQAAHVGGDFSARRMRADLQVDEIGGDALVKDVDGQFAAHAIAGDLRLRNVNGGISAVAGGEARVSFAPVPWQAYHIAAGGALVCRFPDETAAHLQLHSAKPEICLRLPGRSETVQQESYECVLGEAESAPTVALHAGDTLTVRQSLDEASAGPLDDDMALQIESQVLAQLDLAEAELDAHLSDLSAQLGGTRLPEDARRRVRERLQAVRERVRQKVRRARFVHRQAADTHQPVSEDEHLLILRMLQEGKITADEANRLLEALEGQG
ncbi:MAG: hypothetical protein Fur0018_25860 [Anaerolineales bacterium]